MYQSNIITRIGFIAIIKALFDYDLGTSKRMADQIWAFMFDGSLDGTLQTVPEIKTAIGLAKDMHELKKGRKGTGIIVKCMDCGRPTVVWARCPTCRPQPFSA